MPQGAGVLHFAKLSEDRAMHCDVGAAIFPFIIALAAAARVVIGRRTGHVTWRGGPTSESEESSWLFGAVQTLDRDEDPRRFAFWQNVWLAVAILFAVDGVASLGCF